VDAIHRRLVRNIRARARARGILITHLPDRAGLGRTNFFAVMNGKSSPTVRWVAQLARALACDPADLLARSR
jgi:hypothetical protein